MVSRYAKLSVNKTQLVDNRLSHFTTTLDKHTYITPAIKPQQNKHLYRISIQRKRT